MCWGCLPSFGSLRSAARHLMSCLEQSFNRKFGPLLWSRTSKDLSATGSQMECMILLRTNQLYRRCSDERTRCSACPGRENLALGMLWFRARYRMQRRSYCRTTTVSCRRITTQVRNDAESFIKLTVMQATKFSDQSGWKMSHVFGKRKKP